VAGGVAWLRIAIGVVLSIAPRSVLRLQATDEPSGSLVLMTRTVGIRDLVVGIGSLAALRSGSDRDLRRWIRVGLLSDVLDTLAGMFSARLVGKRGASVSALVPVPVIVADVCALSMLNNDDRYRSTARFPIE
jgi:hypothetical protein